MAINTKAKLEFVHAMARHTRATVRQCLALMRYAATLQRLAEDDCNIPMDDAQRAKWEAKRGRIQQRVTELVLSIQGDNHTPEYEQYAPESLIEGIWMKDMTKCAPVFFGDPRGAVLKIRVPDGFSDSFGGEGICVPS